MNQSHFKSGSKSRFRSSKRQELEVDFTLVLVIALALVVATYAIFFPFKESAIGLLLYDRGFTQIIVVTLSAIVIAITILKYRLIKPEYKTLSKIWIAEHIPLDRPESEEVAYLQQRLYQDGHLVALRCSRILGAYIQSGDRAGATEFALDDASFYQSASESSYSLPRILVWAIPLLGFIGTVIGISEAVSGFSGFLDQAGDVEQIKEGIGTVTGGLAVAFDTTLLALFLSVLVMIPLVLVERYESRLLLGIDIFISDKLLPRLRDKNQGLNEKALKKAVQSAIDEHLPQPEALIEPAQNYAQQAAQALAQGFLAEISKVQDVSSQVISQVGEVREIAAQDRQEFMKFFAQQQQANQEAISLINATIEDIRLRHITLAEGLSSQSQEISQQLGQVAKTLETRVIALEKAAEKLSDLKHIHNSIDDSFLSVETTVQMQQVLEGIKDHLNALHPVLKRLNKPRRITFLENDNGNHPNY
ncbi:MAG: MotA/TolQ/ExbB proton channel family protein [Xenococcaceae cyanobacterium MO_167.B27]|nr:MotA/TolQ/ExbB proton channel family protein [Xenococcaceae cyanobacterium MO_167.B27]